MRAKMIKPELYRYAEKLIKFNELVKDEEDELHYIARALELQKQAMDKIYAAKLSKEQVDRGYELIKDLKHTCFVLLPFNVAVHRLYNGLHRPALDDWANNNSGNLNCPPVKSFFKEGIEPSSIEELKMLIQKIAERFNQETDDYNTWIDGENQMNFEEMFGFTQKSDEFHRITYGCWVHFDEMYKWYEDFHKHYIDTKFDPIQKEWNTFVAIADPDLNIDDLKDIQDYEELARKLFRNHMDLLDEGNPDDVPLKYQHLRFRQSIIDTHKDMFNQEVGEILSITEYMKVLDFMSSFYIHAAKSYSKTIGRLIEVGKFNTKEEDPKIRNVFNGIMVEMNETARKCGEEGIRIEGILAKVSQTQSMDSVDAPKNYDDWRWTAAQVSQSLLKTLTSVDQLCESIKIKPVSYNSFSEKGFSPESYNDYDVGDYVKLPSDLLFRPHPEIVKTMKETWFPGDIGQIKTLGKFISVLDGVINRSEDMYKQYCNSKNSDELLSNTDQLSDDNRRIISPLFEHLREQDEIFESFKVTLEGRIKWHKIERDRAKEFHEKHGKRKIPISREDVTFELYRDELVEIFSICLQIMAEFDHLYDVVPKLLEMTLNDTITREHVVQIIKTFPSQKHQVATSYEDFKDKLNHQIETLFMEKSTMSEHIKRLRSSAVSDIINLNDVEADRIVSRWTRDKKKWSDTIPADLFEAGTIPLTDIEINVLPSFDHPNQFAKFRISIYKDYLNKFKHANVQEWIDVGMVIIEMPNIINGEMASTLKFFKVMSVQKLHQDVGTVRLTDLMGYFKRPETLLQGAMSVETGESLDYDTPFVSALKLWYGIQTTLLYPPIKEVYLSKVQTQKKKDKEQGKKKKGKKTKSKVEYVRVVHIADGDFDPVEHWRKKCESEGRPFNRKTPFWTVIGHYRTIPGKKEKTWISNTIKGPERDVGLMMDAERQRVMGTPKKLKASIKHAGIEYPLGLFETKDQVIQIYTVAKELVMKNEKDFISWYDKEIRPTLTK